MCTRYDLRKNVLKLLGLQVETPMVLQMDNKGAVDLINSFSVGGRTCHIDVQQCFLRELKEAKIMVVTWIPGTENEADMFTKNLDGTVFKQYAELLLGKGALRKDSE
jgi:hypothetical protein